MEKNNENLTIKKQELLKKEIIDNKYDKAAFLDFCLSKKENGDDFENWTLEELVDVVNQFKLSAVKNISDEKSGHEKENKKEISKEEIKVDVEKIKIYVKLIKNK